MKIIRILPLSSNSTNRLYRVVYEPDSENILDVLQQQWTDLLWLTEFFKESKKDLEAIAEPMNATKARKKVRHEADVLFKQLRNLKNSELPEFFKPLDNRELGSAFYDFQKVKARIYDSGSWLRLYAVQIGGNYIITGGAIKLTSQMNRRHLMLEIYKMDTLIRTLKGLS